MKKALCLTLALVICLSLVPMTTLAYGNEWIHIQRRTFIQGETIEIHVTGVTPQMVSDGAWVAIYKKGAAHGDVYGDAMRHFNDINDPDYHDYAWFNVPDEDGEYELRLYSKDDGDFSAANLTKYFLSSVDFFVGYNSGFSHGNQWIKLENNNFDPNEKMLIYFFGITQQMVDDYACCYICPKGSRDEILSGCPEVNEVGVSVVGYLTAPVEPGDYEIILLSKWWQNGSVDELFVSSIPFTVGKVAKDGNISLDKTAYTALDPITVTYSGITEKMVNAKAFVRIHEKATGNSSYGGAAVKLGDGALTVNAPNQNGEFEMRLYSVDDGNWNGTDEFLVMSAPFTVSGAMTTSGWAGDQKVAEKAAEYGLIPDSLRGADWTKPITRAEFAAVSVKLYECLADKKADPAAENPFTDTKDAEILKAFNIGVTNGTSATLFSPNDLLNREQAATMLTRALKTAYVPGWTLPTDGNYTLGYTMPEKFADDELISGWAKESVYFMVANKIINGLGNNMFGPRNTTERETAMGYANATREQALAIAVRMVENIKDKPVEFSVGVTSIDPPTAP